MIDARYLNRIVELSPDLHGNADCEPLEYDGEYWLLGYRYPFPADSTWLGVMSRNESAPPNQRMQRTRARLLGQPPRP